MPKGFYDLFYNEADFEGSFGPFQILMLLKPHELYIPKRRIRQFQ